MDPNINKKLKSYIVQIVLERNKNMSQFQVVARDEFEAYVNVAQVVKERCLMSCVQISS